jgi:ADP-ribose pyrophosphatase
LSDTPDSAVQPGQVATRRVHAGRVVQLDIDTVRFPDGSTGDLEMFRHPGASAVVPVLSGADDPDPQILLIRQYRYAADGVIWEIPAGRLDPGEAPLECARRELLEETGATAQRIEPLTTIFTTPGFCDEKIHLFVATGLTVNEADSQREPDEFMELVPLPLSQAIGLIRDGQITDGKTICAVLYFAAFRRGL